MIPNILAGPKTHCPFPTRSSTHCSLLVMHGTEKGQAVGRELRRNMKSHVLRRRNEHSGVSYSSAVLNNVLQSCMLFTVVVCGPHLCHEFLSLCVETSQGYITGHLPTFSGRLLKVIFFAFSSCWFMAFPYVAIKLLESPLRDELMPLKYVSVSCPLMVLFKNKERVGATWFLLKFSFPLL